MQEGEQQAVVSEAKSPIAKILLGRFVSHKVFSDKVLYWLIVGLTFLLPVFFIPGTAVAAEFAKMVLLEVLVLFGIFAWSVGRLRDGKLEVPKSFLLLVAVLLVVQFIVAAVASPAPLVSFIGSGYDIGTVNSFIILFLLMFLSSVVFTNRDRVLTLYAAFLFSGIIVMVYQLLRHFFGPDFLAFGQFTSAVSTPVGKWNDLASVVGALMLMMLSALYFFPTNKTIRIPAYLIFFVGLFFLLAIDFTVLWMILIVTLGMLVALAVFEGEREHKRLKHEAAQSGTTHPHRPAHKRVAGHLPVLATVLLFFALVYGSGLSTLSWGSQHSSISTLVSKALHAAPYSEVVLTPKSTFDIITAEYHDSPLLGTGPNRFGSTFLLHKTTDINRTPFWDTTFDFGIGRVLTYFGTTGLIGTVLWLFFVIFLFLKLRHVMKLLAKDRLAAFIAFSLFLLAVYLWSLAFFYLPNIAVYSLAFIFTGALIAFLVGEGMLGKWSVAFDGNSRLSFIITPIVIVVLVGVVASGVLLYRQVSSLIAARDADIAINAGNVDAAIIAMNRANDYAERDVYHRTLSNLDLIKLSRMNGADMPAADFQAQANQLIADARSNAERAVSLDPTNFENYLQLGGVFDTLGSLGIQNTKDPAEQNYQQALLLNPKSPRIYFMLARLEYAGGDKTKARDYMMKALEERPNFLEAVSFIVQLDLQNNDMKDAITVLQNAVNTEPTNFLMRFALGYLYYQTKDYSSAATQFEAAVILNPVYADAKYFLGLSYNKLGRKQDAIQQFTDVATLNPDNKDVTNILANLKAGRDPFTPPYTAPSQPVNDALSGLNKGNGDTTKDKTN